MTTEPTTIHGKLPERPALTAQKTRINRALLTVLFGAILLLLIYGTYRIWGKYIADPTDKYLLFGLVSSGGTCMMAAMLALCVVPKVEFFQNHLVARSLWGFSRKRSYQEISTLELKRQNTQVTVFFLKVVFNDGCKIILMADDIKLGDLIRYLEERGVTAAKHLKGKRWLDNNPWYYS